MKYYAYNLSMKQTINHWLVYVNFFLNQDFSHFFIFSVNMIQHNEIQHNGRVVQ